MVHSARAETSLVLTQLSLFDVIKDARSQCYAKNHRRDVKQSIHAGEIRKTKGTQSHPYIFMFTVTNYCCQFVVDR